MSSILKKKKRGETNNKIIKTMGRKKKWLTQNKRYNRQFTFVVLPAQSTLYMQILCLKKINKCPPAALQHCCVLYIRRLFYKRGEDPLVSLFWCYTPRALMFLLYLLDVFASYSFTPEMDDNKQLLLKYVYTHITRLFLRYIIIIIRQSKVNKRTAYRIKRKDVGHFVVVDFFIFFWQVDDETLRHWLWLFCDSFAYHHIMRKRVDPVSLMNIICLHDDVNDRCVRADNLAITGQGRHLHIRLAGCVSYIFIFLKRKKPRDFHRGISSVEFVFSRCPIKKGNRERRKLSNLSRIFRLIYVKKEN